MLKNSTLLLLVSLLVFLTACDSPQQSTQAITPQINIEKVNNVAWMREKLPASTLAYLRFPTIWELFFEAKADVLHQAQKINEHKGIINQFKQGIVATYSDLLPPAIQSPFKVLIDNMTTPFEVAVINATDGSMVPNTLIATTLKGTTTDDLNDLLKTITDVSGPQIKIINPFNSSGTAKVLAAMVPVYISFDENTGKLAIFSGLTASDKGLKDMLAQTQHAPELNAIFDFENSVDKAGKNLEIWFNFKSIYQQNKGFIPASDRAIFAQTGLDKMDYVWIGTASARGKSELIFKVAMPDTGFRQFLPRVNSKFDVLTAGTPRSVWQIAIPTVEQMIQGFELAISFQSNPDELRQKTEQMINKVNDYLGVTLVKIINTYGQKLVVVTDNSGTWYASKIINQKSHKEITEKLNKVFNIQTQLKQLAGVEINHSTFSTKAFEEILFEDDGDTDKFKEIMEMFDMTQHAYYQIEGDYYIQAFTPQVLADRGNDNNKLNLSDWLENQQDENWDNAIFAYSKEIKDSPREIYHSYLKVLSFMGNLTNTDVDLFSLPTAQQINLPKSGRFGMTLDSSADAFSFKVSYEYSLFENISYLNSYSMIYVGVLMAYAIPAYRDYTLRTKVSGVYYSVYEEKMLIQEHYLKNKSFPNTEFISEKFNASNNYLYNPKNGEIIIYFNHENIPELTGKSITLTPTIDESNTIVWECYSDVKVQYLLADCQ